MKSSLAQLLILCLAGAEMAAADSAIPEIGPHVKLFLVEKNVNPQNKMVVYSKVNSDCQFVLDESGRPVFGFYWLMEGTKYKPVHNLIQAEIRKRLELEVPETTDALKLFHVKINDLKELDQDIKDPRLDIHAVKLKNGCDVRTEMTLGPSDHNVRIQLQSLYTESKGMVQPQVLAVTIKGRALQGRKNLIERTYKAKGL